MKLDCTVIKNETLLKLEKSLNKVHEKFNEMISIALDTANPEIDNAKRKEIELEAYDMIQDEFRAFMLKFKKKMDDIASLFENGLFE